VLDFEEVRCGAGTGRANAESLADHLRRSNSFRVVERSVWLARLGGGTLGSECRFHPAWAAERIAWLGVDACVIGRIEGLSNGRASVTVKVMDAFGARSGNVSGDSVSQVARALISSRVSRRIRLQNASVGAVVASVRGSTLIVQLQGDADFMQNDRLAVDHVLQTVEDPFFAPGVQRMGTLAAAVGEALVLRTGGSIALTRFSGNWLPRRGELLALSRL
jgi:hypothetical protein